MCVRERERERETLNGNTQPGDSLVCNISALYLRAIRVSTFLLYWSKRLFNPMYLVVKAVSDLYNSNNNNRVSYDGIDRLLNEPMQAENKENTF